jgi:hypothetical protein
MLREIDSYFLQKDEPTKSCLAALRKLILEYDANVTEVWRYKMPFYCYQQNRFCYLWVHKKLQQPYIGFVDGNLIDHNDLILENRSRMKILLIDAEKDIDIKKIKLLLKMAIQVQKKLPK